MSRRAGFYGCLSMAAVLFLSMTPLASAAEIEFLIMRKSGQYYAECSATVPGGVSVSMLRQGEQEWIEFEQYDQDEFDLDSEFYPSLESLGGDIAGDYRMVVVQSGGTSEYTFSISMPDESAFPQYATLAAVPAQIPAEYTFSWTWSGLADVKYVEYYGENFPAMIEVEAVYWSGDPGFDSLSLDADFGDYRGRAEFAIEYINLASNVIVDWTHAAGEDIFPDGPLQALISANEANFQVGLEPYCGDENHPRPPMDFTGDCRVDFRDFAIFASYWMVCTAPECD